MSEPERWEPSQEAVDAPDPEPVHSVDPGPDGCTDPELADE